MAMDHHAFGPVPATMAMFDETLSMSTPVSSFTSGLSAPDPYYTASVTGGESFHSIFPTPAASVGSMTEEPASPFSHTGTLFEMQDISRNSPTLERSYSGLDLDGPAVPVFNSIFPVAPMAPMSTHFQDGEPILSHPQATHLHNQLIMSRGPSTIGSRPSTRNSIGLVSVASSETSHTVPEVRAVSVDDSVENSGPSSPASSSGQTEGRDHEYYRLPPGEDGLYHCPYEGPDCNFPPKQLKCDYHKHIDSHLKPFKCRSAECANLSFSSVACRLRHEREMHRMHNAKEQLCRYHGYCERKLPGRGFPRSFNRGDHERRVHGMEPDNTRAKGRPKNSSNETTNAHPAVRRGNLPRKPSVLPGPSHSDESSASTVSSPVAPLTAIPHGLSMPMSAPVPIPAPVSHYPSHPLMAPASVPLVGPFGGNSRGFVRPVPTTGPIIARRPSMPSLSVKTGRVSPIGGRFSKYSHHKDRLQQLVNRLPSIPDQTLMDLEQSIAQEFEQLRRAHAGVASVISPVAGP